MSTVNVTFRVDESLKQEAEVLYKDLGMSLSTAFNVFLRQSIREQRLPFEVRKNVPNATTIAAIKAAEQGKMNGPYNSVDELLEVLNAND